MRRYINKTGVVLSGRDLHIYETLGRILARAEADPTRLDLYDVHQRLFVTKLLANISVIERFNRDERPDRQLCKGARPFTELDRAIFANLMLDPAKANRDLTLIELVQHHDFPDIDMVSDLPREFNQSTPSTLQIEAMLAHDISVFKSVIKLALELLTPCAPVECV